MGGFPKASTIINDRDKGFTCHYKKGVSRPIDARRLMDNQAINDGTPKRSLTEIRKLENRKESYRLLQEAVEANRKYLAKEL